MVWHAKITKVETMLDKTNEAIEVTVLFHEDDSRTYTKIYKLWLNEMSGYTLTDFKTIVQADLDSLIKLDTMKNVLISKIGIDIWIS